MNAKRALLALAFLATVPLANVTLDRYGFVDVPWLGMVPSGVVFIAPAFVLRDLLQVEAGKRAVVAAIVAGAAVSWALADPGLASASLAAFAVAETVDFAIFTALRRRFLLAVLASSVVGACLDSVVFLWVAFDATDGWWSLAVAKCLIVAAVAPLAARWRP